MAGVKLQVQHGGALARVTLARPDKFNAFDRETLRELGDMMRGVSESEKVRVLAISGEGKAFCAGADLRAALLSDSLSNYLGSLVKAFHSVLETLATCPALVVTVINGAAAGGGFSLAMAGDLRIGFPECAFRIGYGRVGLSVDGGLSWRLPRLVGMAQAQRLLLQDPDIGPEEAEALGLIHQTLPAADLDKALGEILERTKLQSRGAIAKNRQLLWESFGRTMQASMEAEAIALKASAGTNDGREGVQAFVQKRPPNFGA